MRRAPLPLHLTTGSFSLRAADKAGVTRTRTEAQDLVTVSRGIRVPVDSASSGAAALRAYTELDDESILSLGSAARLWARLCRAGSRRTGASISPGDGASAGPAGSTSWGTC